MPLRAVTFDVYSALFDTVSGLAAAVADVVRHRFSKEDPRTIAQTWRDKQAEYLLLSNSLERDPASNRAAIETAARFALRQFVPPLSRKEHRSLLAVGTTAGVAGNGRGPRRRAGQAPDPRHAEQWRRRHVAPAARDSPGEIRSPHLHTGRKVQTASINL